MRRAYGPLVRLRLVENYQGGWKEIVEFEGNLTQTEGKTTKEMQQFWRKATKYCISDGIL